MVIDGKRNNISIAILGGEGMFSFMILNRYAVYLSLTALSLAACGDLRDSVREKYTGERHGEPVVGARRAPVLNPGYAASAPVPPASTIVPGRAPAAPTPYDQYDASGSETTRRNNGPTDDGTVRKTFKGAVGTPVIMPSSVAVPTMVSPVSEMPKRIEAATPPPEKITPQVWNKPVVDTAPAEPIAGAKDIPVEMRRTTLPPEEDNGVFLPDLPERSDTALPEGIDFAELQPAAGGGPSEPQYLANVPKTPAQFKPMKAERGMAAQQMQVTHDAAMEQKKILGEEPSELVPAIPQTPAAGN